MQDGKKNASESLNEQSVKGTEQAGASEGTEGAKGPKEPKNSEAQEAGKQSAESAKSDAQPSDKAVKEASAQETSDRTVSDGASDAKPAAKAADSTESTEPAKEADSEKEPKQSSSKQPVKSAKTETADKAKSEDKAKKPAQGEKEDQGDKGKVLAEPARFEKLRAAVLNLGWKKWTAIAVVAAVLLGAGLFLAFGTSHTIERSDRDAGENIYMVVKPGTTASEISDRLMQLGVIDSRLRFWWLMKLQGDAGKFKTGTYAFTPHMDEQAVLDKLVSGDTTVVKFTIPEGFGIKEIAKRLADEGLVDEQEFLAEAKDFAPYDYMKKRPNVRYAAEGYLFPDTYVIHSDVSAEGIMKMMAEDFDTRLTPALRQQAAAKGLSIHDLITLASLVEKEARYDEDRPIIAQVFFKRLQMGMPLQSDTTLQYLMAGPKEDVSIEDTKIDSPYNTYQHEGLPPGPIASPGMKSILAVLNPANTDYLYFVADRQGHNHYSQTYDEHLAIVEQVR
ncbi:endolytic transglycosylase MltG [Mitsuokella multacida]|uniref:endolytic transglycosylase MltG n=1 Tax=Mitsuokella multacida TaxID=52226 RepID=UPI0022E1EB8D|nr:endolytic transglycosylase MltG [Mitsuokella multacida]